MGIFDKMFGKDASDEHQNRFEELKTKYSTVLGAIEQHDVQLQNLHVENDKLVINGTAPSDQAKDFVWDQIKLVDAENADISANITVVPGLGVTNDAGGATQSYTVQPGDTLSAISQKYYGSANEYMKIFYANRDKLNDPNMIQVGQELVIPADDNV